MENLWYLLALAACPLGMGLMMWMMMRNNKSHAEGSTLMSMESTADGRPAADTNPDDRLAGLRAQLREVQARQAAIAEQMGRLPSEDRPTTPDDVAPSEPLPPASPPARAAGANGTAAAVARATGRARNE